MKAYEDKLYEQWKDNVEAILPSLLKKNLLVKPHERALTIVMDEEKKGESEAGNVSRLFSLFSIFMHEASLVMETVIQAGSSKSGFLTFFDVLDCCVEGNSKENNSSDEEITELRI